MARKASGNPTEGRQVTRLPLNNLLLDPKNARFGFQGESNSQAQILDDIVEKFGVGDILSSLAVNGYFEAEPLVCREDSRLGKAVVVEGNRRLAACLIITGDERAANQAKRSADSGKLWKEHHCPAIDPVPVILFEEEEQQKAILSYLGVRHIAASQPWDSYAKAAWVAQVIERSGLDIESVARMIGDRHRTVNRLLEGYYLVQQLVNKGKFIPEDSVRRGRGSVTQYPFSWVYTVIGYVTVREFLDLADGNAQEDPVAEDKLDNGGLLLKVMFGDKSRGRNAAIEDSRQLGDLASALASREKIQLLEQGKTLTEIETLTQPVGQRLSDGLGLVRDTLRDLIARLSEEEIKQSTASDLVPTSRGNHKMAGELEKKLREIAFGSDDED